MNKLHPVRGAGEPEEAAVAADRIAEGSPRTMTAIDYERDGKLYAGEWSASVGAWSVRYDEWEFCHVLEGVCELETSDGAKQRFGPGRQFRDRTRLCRRLARA